MNYHINRIAFSIISIAFACFFCYACHAQTDGIYDFVPGEKVVFRDDFHTGLVSAFPEHWQLSAGTMPHDNYSKAGWTIQKGDENYILRSTTTFVHISPVVKPALRLVDSFTIEFDCLIEEPASCAELYFSSADSTLSGKEVSVHLLSWGKINIIYPNGDTRYTADYPGEFDFHIWHHFSLSFINKKLSCYVDGYPSLKIPGWDITPGYVSLGCIAPVKYSHFNISRITANSSVNDLLSKGKFVTHAIHFPQNKAEIKPESMGIIGELVNFLIQNPTISLRIDGHTDADGNAADNMTLSQARAAAVKRLLVDRGIDEKRLTIKGFGASKPIRPNNSADNKAENRRVEFVKM